VQSLTQSPSSPDPIPSIATQPHFGRARSPLTTASNSHTSRTSARLLSAASFLGESCVCPNNPVLGGGGMRLGEICLYKRHETNTWQLKAPGLDCRLRPSLRTAFVFKLLDHLPPSPSPPRPYPLPPLFAYLTDRLKKITINRRNHLLY